MKSTCFVLALSVMSCPNFARSQDSSLAAEVSIGSKYLDRGMQLGDFTWHPSLEYGYGDAYAGYWAALPLEHKGSPDFFEDEHDLYAGYGWALGNKVALDVGGTYYLLERSSDTFEAYAGLNGELGTFSPSLYFFYDFELEAFAVELSTGVALPLEGFPVEATAYVGFSESQANADYRYFGIDLIYPIQLSDRARLGLGIHYADNDAGFGVPDSHLYGSAALTVGF